MCAEGYYEDFYGVCTDVDECLEGTDYCTPPFEECVNTAGSYDCVCAEGYHDVDGVCEEISASERRWCSPVSGYRFHSLKDSWGGDIKKYSTLSMAELGEKSSSDPNCKGFNTAGYLKRAIKSELDPYGGNDSCNGLYTKRCEYSTLDGYRFYSRKDSWGYDCSTDCAKDGPAISYRTLSIAELEEKCSADPHCEGFNTAGYLKSAIKSELDPYGGTDECSGLYKRDTPGKCVTVDGRSGTCINRQECIRAGKEPVPATSSYDPKPNCWVYPVDIQCCAENGSSPLCSEDPVLGTTFVNYMKLVEGYVGAYPYESLEGGNPTVGYGHKLTDQEVTSGTYSSGLSKRDAEALLIKDIKARIPSAISVYENRHGYGSYQTVSAWGKRMLVDKVFQTGAGGLAQFVKMMKAIYDNNSEIAKAEMLTGYNDKNGIWHWDYGRREKFIKYCMNDCK